MIFSEPKLIAFRVLLKMEEKQTEDKALAVASRLKDGPQSRNTRRELEFDNPVSDGSGQK